MVSQPPPTPTHGWSGAPSTLKAEDPGPGHVHCGRTGCTPAVGGQGIGRGAQDALRLWEGTGGPVFQGQLYGNQIAIQDAGPRVLHGLCGQLGPLFAQKITCFQKKKSAAFSWPLCNNPSVVFLVIALPGHSPSWHGGKGRGQPLFFAGGSPGAPRASTRAPCTGNVLETRQGPAPVHSTYPA
jgi:hypothetical protein